MEFEIIGENLECVLTLPEKFRTHIEGLAGNFNGNYNDDLTNRQTNQIIAISTSANRTALNNDADVLSACRSCKFDSQKGMSLIRRSTLLGKVANDTTPDNSTPIMPTAFVNWYYNNASGLLATLNPLLSQTMVNQTCGSNFECVHDYLIRINAFTSGATGLRLQELEQARTTLGKVLYAS